METREGIRMRQRTRKKGLIFHLMLFFLLADWGSAICADTWYISDTLYVALREGKGTEHTAISVLRSDTPLTVLREEGNYVMVQTSAGETGWISKKYVTPTPPKSLIVEKLETQLNQLEKEADKNRTIASQKARELEEITEKYGILLDQSKAAVELSSNLEKISDEKSRMTKEMNHLRDENLKLRGTVMLNWFIAGGAVFFVGLLAGKFLTPRKNKFY
ncbi:MAG: hypothetical protein B6245_02715 [Desulfobacteraceae bacterium 4572_88]|nr:MAG: hypothetical protein B6245_02715 [Desulfobacteraceae bacterium 4572_88]